MSIAQLLARNCKQTLVYWASPTPDGYGGFTYSDPTEIMGRWEDMQELIKTTDGEEQLSQARVWLMQDVDEGGYLYLGTLDDLDSDPQPEDIPTAGRIMTFTRLPELGTTDLFLRKVNINMSSNRSF